MTPHVNLEGACTWAAFLALGKRTYPFVGVGVFGLFFNGRRGGALPAGTIVHEVCLQIALAAIPDATVLAGKHVLWNR